MAGRVAPRRRDDRKRRGSYGCARKPKTYHETGRVQEETDRKPSKAGLAREAVNDVTSVYLDDAGHKIHPLTYVAQSADPLLANRAALLLDRFDLGLVSSLIDGLPVVVAGREVMPPQVREFHKRCLSERLSFLRSSVSRTAPAPSPGARVDAARSACEGAAGTPGRAL